MPRMSRARSISWRRISVMFASTSGRSILGLRIEPRSPPVQVATCTSTPSATYFAVVAAPLLDSSSGCACTCISRSMGAILGGGHRTYDDPVTDLAERYGAPSRARRPVMILLAVVLAAALIGWLAWATFLHSRPEV